MNSLDDVWSSLITLLRQNLTQVAITTWFEDCRVLELNDRELVLFTPSDFKREIIESRFSDEIKKALNELFSCDFELSVVGPAMMSSKKEEDDAESVVNARNAEYTFDRFVVGNSNKFAHAAAVAVAEEQTSTYNPLFIYGESGLGKTHLIYAIRNRIQERHPDYKIVYVRCEEFINEMVSAIQHGKNVEFRNKYRNADLFLMDDVQFVAGKSATEEELFHTFNTLFESNRQIVFTSDRPPHEIAHLTDRLKTRFESGLVADIQPPDYETRMAIVRKKASLEGLVIPDDVTNYIAENVKTNVRQIEGAVKKIAAHKALMNETLTVSSVTNIIRDMFKEDSTYAPTPDIIIDETARYFSLSSEYLKGQSRTKQIANARQIAMYLIRDLTTLPLADIGAIFEGRDHTTVLNAISRVKENMNNVEYAKIVKDIVTNINAHY